MSEFRISRKPAPSPVQRSWLRRGLEQPGGKLPLFDEQGQEIDPRTILACIEQGWAAPWFKNPIKPNWLVCKLTDSGRRAIAGRLTRPVAVVHKIVELERSTS